MDGVRGSVAARQDSGACSALNLRILAQTESHVSCSKGPFTRESDFRAAKCPPQFFDAPISSGRGVTITANQQASQSAATNPNSFSGSSTTVAPHASVVNTSVGSVSTSVPLPAIPALARQLPPIQKQTNDLVEQRLLLDEMRAERRRLETSRTRLALQVEHLKAEEQKFQDHLLLEQLRGERKRLEVQLARVQMQVRHLQSEENWMVDPIGKDEIVEIERP